MAVCASCGRENKDDFAFCPYCGAAFAAAAPAREQRKVVTVLFCDVVGSTALGEEHDPEALRALLARYFETMKQIVESHGGTVEKFIGDAVMAVFGVPVVHEDDALRALRAAVEMREALPELGIRCRIGVATGEVVSGTEERLATGDAVNVAARLEQSAQASEILIGKQTYGLTRAAVQVGPVEPRALKGKSEPTVAYRLVSVHSGEGFARRLDAPMVGRERELRQLADAWGRTVAARSCHLFTILGAAGVGKSRLAGGFLDSHDEALVVQGRCLPYGEGITYWPVVEVLKQLPEADLDAVAAETIRALVGGKLLASSSGEIAWAFRKRLEAVAADRPLVCVFDDVHWGKETFLDLVEHVADLSRDAPILLLCMARPELLDRRTAWAGGKLNATNVLLDPLDPDQTDRLIASLADLDKGLRARIRDAAEGNPLFVEVMVSLALESDQGEVSVPPTIQALLAARLDQLEPSERGVLERGAVEGRVFHRGAVQALAPDEPQVTAHLNTLVRKELIRPDKPQLPGEDAFRFRHLLIRDAAYDALPKGTRAEFHARLAAWLSERGADLVELDEILGHHLEQAFRYREELGSVDEADRELALAAGEHLGSAGRKALARRDFQGAASLIERAVALLSSDERAGLRLLPDLGTALSSWGEFSAADAVLTEAIQGAQALRERGTEWHAIIERAWLRFEAEPTLNPIEDMRLQAEEAVSVFEELGDEQGQARAWWVLGEVENTLCRYSALEDIARRAAEHARRAGDAAGEDRALGWQTRALVDGPTPVEEAIRRCNEILEEVRDCSRAREALVIAKIGSLHAMAARFDEARALHSRAGTMAEDFGISVYVLADNAVVHILAGDLERAEQLLSAYCKGLREIGDKGHLSTYAGTLARVLAMLDRNEEAEELAAESKKFGADDDVATQILWRGARARVLARQGQSEDARRLAREAVELAEETDQLNMHADVLLDLAEVLRLGERPDDATLAIEQALQLYERKGNVAAAALARVFLDDLQRGTLRA